MEKFAQNGAFGLVLTYELYGDIFHYPIVIPTPFTVLLPL